MLRRLAHYQIHRLPPCAALPEDASRLVTSRAGDGAACAAVVSGLPGGRAALVLGAMQARCSGGNNGGGTLGGGGGAGRVLDAMRPVAIAGILQDHVDRYPSLFLFLVGIPTRRCSRCSGGAHVDGQVDMGRCG